MQAIKQIYDYIMKGLMSEKSQTFTDRHGVIAEVKKSRSTKSKKSVPVRTIFAKDYDPCGIVSFGLGAYHRNHKGKWVHKL